MRTLRVAAAVEAASLALLLGNLVTVHASAVSGLLGPLHGTAYLVTIATAWPLGGTARALALVPGVGGLLVLRRVRNPGRQPSAAPAPAPGGGGRP
ncbi:hypothetical protein SALBM135S_00133 [Streptomyces alboniger]